MMTTTPIPDALEALRNGAQVAYGKLELAQTDKQRAMAQFWIDYFARQIARWEGRQGA